MTDTHPVFAGQWVVVNDHTRTRQTEQAKEKVASHFRPEQLETEVPYQAPVANFVSGLTLSFPTALSICRGKAMKRGDSSLVVISVEAGS